MFLSNTQNLLPYYAVITSQKTAVLIFLDMRATNPIQIILN
jgi:hypothetical protein